MQYEIETNYRFYLSNNLPEQFKNSFVLFGKIKEPNHSLFGNRVLVRIKESQRMITVFNNFLLILFSWKMDEKV